MGKRGRTSLLQSAEQLSVRLEKKHIERIDAEQREERAKGNTVSRNEIVRRALNHYFGIQPSS